MADSRLQLEIFVETGQANASLRQVNTQLADFERTAVRSARGAAQGMDGYVAVARDAAVASGGLWKSVAAGAAIATGLTGALQKLANSVKSFTIDAVMLAARVETLGVALHAVSRANGLSAASVDALVDRIKALGITTQAARQAVARMAAAHLDLSRATELARMAQDAAVISGQNSSEALQGIVHGIVTQQTEVLRTYGIIVQFDRAFTEARHRLGRDLTEVERRNIALLEVLKQAPSIAGAYEAAMGTAGKQMTSLARHVEEAKRAIGERFLPELGAAVKALTVVAQWFHENSGAVATFARFALAGSLAGALTYVIRLLWQARAAANAFTFALAKSPWGMIAVGLTTIGGLMWDYYARLQQTREAMSEFGDEAARAGEIIRRWASGATVDDLKKLGYSVSEIQRAFLGAKSVAAGAGEIFQSELSSYLKVINERELQELREQEARKLGDALAKFQREAERHAAEHAARIARRVGEGTAAAIIEAAETSRQLTIYTDEKSIAHRVRLTASAQAALENALRTAADRARKEWATREVEQVQEENRRRMEFHADLLRGQLAAEQQFFEDRLSFANTYYQHQERMAALARERELAGIREMTGATLTERLATEQRRAEIEVSYLRRVHEIRMHAFDEESQRLIELTALRLRASGLDEETVRQRIEQLQQERTMLRRMHEEEFEGEIFAVQREAAARQAELIADHNQRVFESLKRQAEGVFDALLTRSQSVFAAIGNALKTAVLTAIKEIVTSRVAAMLMELFAGLRMPVGTAAGRGSLAGLAMAPALAAAGPIPGGAAGGWGTPPFLPAPGGGWRGWLSGLAAGWREFLGTGGSIQIGPGLATTWQAATFWQKLGAIGRSPAAALGGGLLALAGLQRGGLSGLGMSTAGGALLGFKFGGPIGAAIGAAGGFVAGLVRLFRKSAEEKAREKIRATYGVDIRDKGVLRQIVETAKQAFGGNLDAAIRSQQIRELIELYAMTTGQSTAGLPPTVRPVTLLQQSGALYQQSLGWGGAPALDRIAAGTPQAAGPIVINISVPGAKEFFEKETVRVVVDNPRAVQSATLSATRANAGRRELAALQFSPGLVMT